MYSPLKQRITGAIVIISLIVIFVPMILTDKGEQFLTQSGSNIPPLPSYEIQVPKLELPASIPEPPQPSVEPESDTAVEETPEIAEVDTSEQKSSDQTTTLPPAKKPKDQAEYAEQDEAIEKPEKPAKTEQANKPATVAVEKPVSGWVVQMGSFSKQANAKRLRDKLRKKGYATFIVTVENKKGTSYRVRVGPELSKERTDKLQTELYKAFKIKGLVMDYP